MSGEMRGGWHPTYPDGAEPVPISGKRRPVCSIPEHKTLARDHAALLDWAEWAAVEMSLLVHGGRASGFTYPTLNALLAEWAEMQERPS